MEIKEFKNLQNFSNEDLHKVIADCDEKLTKMTVVEEIDHILEAQEAAVAELQKRNK